MLTLSMRLKNETKTCFRFERRDDAGNLITLYLKKADVNDATKRSLIASFDVVLGLDLLGRAAALKEKEAEAAAGEDAGEVEALISARTEAKKAKNWAEADRIRDELKAMGIEIKDTPGGVEWKRI